MSGTRDDGHGRTAIDQNMYGRPPERIPRRPESPLLSYRIRTVRRRTFSDFTIVLLLSRSEAPVCSRLWIDLWITFIGSIQARLFLTITEIEGALLTVTPPQTSKNGLPLLLLSSIHMWAKCGQDAVSSSKVRSTWRDQSNPPPLTVPPMDREYPLFLGLRAPISELPWRLQFQVETGRIQTHWQN